MRLLIFSNSTPRVAYLGVFSTISPLPVFMSGEARKGRHKVAHDGKPWVGAWPVELSFIRGGITPTYVVLAGFSSMKVICQRCEDVKKSTSLGWRTFSGVRFSEVSRASRIHSRLLSRWATFWRP